MLYRLCHTFPGELSQRYIGSLAEACELPLHGNSIIYQVQLAVDFHWGVLIRL